MTRDADIEELAVLIHLYAFRPDQQNEATEASCFAAARKAVEDGWTAPARLVEAMWIAAGGDLHDAPGQCTVVCEVDVEAGQTVYITQSVMHPNIRRHSEGAPTRIALHAAKAGEELRVK